MKCTWRCSSAWRWSFCSIGRSRSGGRSRGSGVTLRRRRRRGRRRWARDRSPCPSRRPTRRTRLESGELLVPGVKRQAEQVLLEPTDNVQPRRTGAHTSDERRAGAIGRVDDFIMNLPQLAPEFLDAFCGWRFHTAPRLTIVTEGAAPSRGLWCMSIASARRDARPTRPLGWRNKSDVDAGRWAVLIACRRRPGRSFAGAW